VGVRVTVGVVYPDEPSVLSEVLEVLDNGITYRRRYQDVMQAAPVLDPPASVAEPQMSLPLPVQESVAETVAEPTVVAAPDPVVDGVPPPALHVEPKVEAKREPAFDMPMPPVPARPRETRLAAERRIPEVARKPVVERGPAILKSGVIDGMPYTLYADGSIEAQLAQGMVKFASVDALRAHLEKQS